MDLILLIKIWLFFKILIQFSFLTLEMYGFKYFNQILLSLFNVSNAFYDNIWVVYTA